MAKTATHTKTTKKAKSPSTQRSTPSAESPLPAWFLLVTGMLLGLFIAFLYYLLQLQPTQQQLAHINQDIPATPAPATTKTYTAPKAAFDFYTRLQAVEDIPTLSTPTLPASTKPSHDTPFILQAGSFRSTLDADNRRAAILMLNLDVAIQRVELQPDDTWHRVIVGPFTRQYDLEQALDLLADNDIESLTLRLK